MPDSEVIEKKLRRILLYLQELRRLSFMNLEDFQEDIVKKRFVERNIELCIEAMIDVCRHLVSSLNLQEPESYADCFRILARGSVITDARQKTFAEMARFRNRLIHIYDDVDDSITFDIYSNRLSDFDDFVNVIRGYIRSCE
ncbi:MAG: antitoxin [Prosthecochloris sp.]|nr:antitoxin [Prosthecochloris sp.]